MEETVQSHVLELSRSLDEYRAAVRKAQDHFSFEVEQLWRDQAALRDELHEGITSLSNRIEGVLSFVTSNPAEVAAKIVTDANRGMANGKRCPTCDGFGKVVKTAENATEPGPMGMPQTCVTCAGTGAIHG